MKEKVKVPVPLEEAQEWEQKGLLEPDLEDGGYKFTTFGNEVICVGILKLEILPLLDKTTDLLAECLRVSQLFKVFPDVKDRIGHAQQLLFEIMHEFGWYGRYPAYKADFDNEIKIRLWENGK